MHTTTFAALANMSPHIQNIDGYAAQRMISVLQLLSKKYHRICGKLDSIRRAEVGATISAGGDTVTVEPAPAASSGPLETEETVRHEHVCVPLLSCA